MRPDLNRRRRRPVGRVLLAGAAGALAVLAGWTAAGATATSGGAGTSGTRASRSAAGLEAWVTTGAFASGPAGTVTPVDLVAHRADPAVTTGSQAAGLAATPDGRSLLVANQGVDTLSVVDTATGSVTATVPVGLEPDAVAVVPGGSGGHGTALVANRGGNTVTPVDLATMKAGKPIPVGHQPDAIAIAIVPGGTSGSAAAGGSAVSPTGGVALVANFGDGTVTPIDLATMQPGPAVSAGSEPDAIGIVPTSAGAAATALVADFGTDTVIPVDPATMADGPAVGLGGNPTGIAVAPDGPAWVVDGASLTPLTVSGPATSATLPPPFTAGAPLKLPDVGEALALQGTGTAWVALEDGTLSPVSLPSGTVGRAVHLGGRPSAVAIPKP